MGKGQKQSHKDGQEKIINEVEQNLSVIRVFI